MKSKNSPAKQDYLIKQAFSLHESGNLSEAASKYKSLSRLFPNHPIALTGLGTIAHQLGDHAEAVRLLNLSLKIAPDQLTALFQRANALKNLNRLEEALINYDRLILLKPDFAEAYNNKGNTLKILKRYKEALASYDQALLLKPDFVQVYNNRGDALKSLQQFEDALASYDQALILKPDFPEAHNNRGLLLHIQGHLDKALESYEKAISLNPSFAEPYNNRGKVLQDLHRIDEALASYEYAIKLRPDYASAYWNKALTKLLMGDFQEGWKLYEWRWKDTMKEYIRDFTQPLWLGEQSLTGKTLLIHTEQGLGDFIQFCRYVPLAESLGAKVILELPGSLASLISTLSGNYTIIKKGGVLPAFDLHCPIMSLPLAFKTSLSTIPAHTPYLFIDKEKEQRWNKLMGRKVRPRIGLVWSGSSKHQNDHNRSIDLRLFEPLLNLPFEFHSLQKEVPPKDADALSQYVQIKTHQGEINDFSDTAALAKELDLIISVDTSVSHLAGALGLPVWILLPYAPDYRWMLDREDTPWYPTATLLRQLSPGDWSNVISEIILKLQSKLTPFDEGPP